MSFKDLGLSPALLTALDDAGYTQPTPIQSGAIPVALSGRDVLGIAQTGTGKTASFVLPMIERLSRGRAKARMPRSLIVEPTRELAAQVAENFEKYAKNFKLNMALLIGGVAFGPQEKILNQGADVLIATPGRLLDHFERGRLLLNGVQILVVDEADRMLDMGFIPDLERIFSLTPPVKQTLFFSATMPPEIQRLVSRFLKDPERVEVAKPATTAATVRQLLVRVPDRTPKTKRALLRAALDQPDVKNGIIFCNRKRDVDVVARSLQRHNYSADPIHGDLEQRQRMATLDRFKTGELRFLVASDVAARGLDIPAVSHVFNFDVPHHADDYVHRIGRTGRAGLSGVSVTLAGPEDAKNLAAVVKLIGKDIEEVRFGGGAPAAPEAGEPAAQTDARDGDKPASGRSRSRRGRKPADGESRPAPAADAARPRTPGEKGDRERSEKRGDKGDERRGGDRNEDGERKVTGFGADMPDFFRRR
ncbi:MAG: DEAD/DEAH box helicase [Maricaulaceae bacterium]|nr:DEAD/DEAH box helicase [Maricaulaceae bacterium]